jgi:ketosteroid isomerase-like protein
MSAQENKALVRRFLAILGAQDLTSVDDVLSSDYTLHLVGLPHPVEGLAAWKETISTYFAAFPDLQVELEDEIAEGIGWSSATSGGRPSRGLHGNRGNRQDGAGARHDRVPSCG